VDRADDCRSEINLDRDWRFHFGTTAGAEAPGFDDAAWSAVSLPHTWNALDGQDGVKTAGGAHDMRQGDYARGTGWYRRIIRPAAAWANRQIYLQLDGANRRADVFLNGQRVGTHLGGHARFRFDLTGKLRPGQGNVLAIRVNNEDNDIIPASADFTFFGGIYRSVTLLVTDPVQVETMDCGSPGVYLQQTAVSAERAEVRVRVEVANHESGPVAAAVHVLVTDAAGRVVTEGRQSVALAAQDRGEVTLPVALERPHLWNGRADPYLYGVRVEISAGGTVRDVVTQPLGLRFFRVDPQQGFLLNGHYLDLHGVSRHQDRLNKGWAVSEADEREDFSLIAAIGCTAVRVSHYQQSPLWYLLADEQGLVLWSEVPFVDEARASPGFFNNALQQMREMIRQNYNHPAVCFWGCGNENSDAGMPFVEGIAHYAPHSEELIQALNALAHAEDPTRLTTYASYHSETAVEIPQPGQAAVRYEGEPQRWYTDVTAFNRYYGWYYGEARDVGSFFDAKHARYPTRCIGVSEYGAGSNVLQHEAANYGGAGYRAFPAETRRPIGLGPFHPEEYQAYYHEQAWKALQARPYLWVKFVWTMFDFASDGRSDGGQAGRNDKGLVTYDRKIKKDAFYFYQANWSSEPVLHLTGRRFDRRTEPVTEVKIYSNAPAAELFVNGRSLGRRPVPADRIVRWSGVRLDPGENRIRTTATFGAIPLSDECVWHLESHP